MIKESTLNLTAAERLTEDMSAEGSHRIQHFTYGGHGIMATRQGGFYEVKSFAPVTGKIKSICYTHDINVAETVYESLKTFIKKQI